MQDTPAVDTAVELGAGVALAVPNVACLMDGGLNSGGDNSGEAKRAVNTFNGWYMPEEGCVIDGLVYKGHSLERMAPNTYEVRQELVRRALRRGQNLDSAYFKKNLDPRGISPAQVKEVTKVVCKKKGRRPKTWEYVARGLRVVTNLKGEVVTVVRLKG